MFRFVALVEVLLGSTSHKRGCGNQARSLMCTKHTRSQVVNIHPLDMFSLIPNCSDTLLG